MSPSVYLIRRAESISSLFLRLSQSQLFLLASGCNNVGSQDREEEGGKKGNSPELVAERNPPVPSRKHQHVIILTAAALQLTVMYTREILLVAARETRCQQQAEQNKDRQKITVD